MLFGKQIFAYVIVYVLVIYLNSVKSFQETENTNEDTGNLISSNTDKNETVVNITVNKEYFKEMEIVIATCRCKNKANCKIEWKFLGKEPNPILCKNSTQIEIEQEIQFQAEEPLLIVCWSSDKKAHDHNQIFVSDLDSPVEIRRNPDTERPIIGQSFELTCEAISGNYSRVEWYRNGTKLEKGSLSSSIKLDNFNRSFNIGKTIRFNEIIEEDTGFYQCKAFYTSNFNDFIEKQSYISIQRPLPVRIAQTNSNEVKVTEGSDWEMKCQFGYDLKWFKDEKELSLDKEDSRMLIMNNGTTLVVKSFTKDDEGTYRCTGDNESGSHETISRVVVETEVFSGMISIFVYVTVGILILLSIVLTTYFLLKRKTRASPHEFRNLRNNDGYEVSLNEVELQRLNPVVKPNNFHPDLIPTTTNIRNSDDQTSNVFLQKQTSQVDETVVELRSHDDDDIDLIINRTLKSVHQESVNFMQPAAIAKFAAYVRRSALIQKKRSLSFKRLREENDLFATLCQDYHFPEDRLEFTQELGSGAYGSVRHAFAYDLVPGEEKTSVAVKNFRLDNKYGRNALLTEIKVLTHVGEHKNVVNLLGIITKATKGEFMLMMEYCSLGNIRDFLRKNEDRFFDEINPETGSIESIAANGIMKTQVPFTTTHLVSWSFQVARGMTFLSSKGIIHGDLAARNILLCEDNFVKICDFGLSKIKQESNYYRRRTGMIPVKWIAPETFKDNEFSTYTDVWSFGVVLWELFALGREPYDDISQSLIHLKLQGGYRMEKPRYATEELYALMRRCWSSAFRARPSFQELEKEIGKLLDRKMRLFIMSFDGPYILMNLESDKIREPFDIDLDSDILNLKQIYEDSENELDNDNNKI